MDIHDLIALLQIFTAFLAAFAASSGFWIFVDRKRSNKDNSNKLLMGLAYSRIVTLSLEYIERGSITHDEYEMLCKYLYTPYVEMGGNGSVKRLMDEVNKLRVVSGSILEMKGTKDVPK